MLKTKLSVFKIIILSGTKLEKKCLNELLIND